MTDNGSSAGCQLDRSGFVTRGYNAGMRGMKASRYDGGHRVPWFVRWPHGGLDGGREVTEMCLAEDVLPTLIDLCQLEAPGNRDFDGTSLAPLLRGETERLPGDRIHHVDLRQATDPPDIWDGCVMTRDWRLVRGRELYNIHTDPGQHEDVAERYPDVVQRLRTAQEDWWREVTPRMEQFAPISIGAPEENPTRLDSMDVCGDVAWNQCHVAMAQKSTGLWQVNVEQTGHYRFELRRWPEELNLPVDAGISPDAATELAPYRREVVPQTIQPVRARLKLADQEVVVDVPAGSTNVVIELELPHLGQTQLEAWFQNADGGEQGAYYVYVHRQ